VAEARLLAVHVRPHIEVVEDQPMVDLETDKATVTIDCPFTGAVLRIHRSPGDLVRVGDTIISFVATRALTADRHTVQIAVRNLRRLRPDELCSHPRLGHYDFAIVSHYFQRAQLAATQIKRGFLDNLSDAYVDEFQQLLLRVWSFIVAVRRFDATRPDASNLHADLVHSIEAHMASRLAELWSLYSRAVERARPQVFIGSSIECLDYARVLQDLMSDVVDCHVWKDDPEFQLGTFTLEALEARAKKSDFGVFVFGSDDIANIRGRKHAVTRANVVLEAGLFIGRLGRARTFIVRHADSLVLSDLRGVTTATFASDPPERSEFGPIVTRITDAIVRICPWVNTVSIRRRKGPASRREAD
jgi:predicted nucleotide-binding protein